MNVSPQTKIKLPTLISAGSLILIILLALFFSPLNNVITVIVFFILFFAFCFNGLLTLFRLQTGEKDNVAASKKAFIISSLATFFLMMRSAKALNLVDFLLLVLFFIGISFYARRR